MSNNNWDVIIVGAGSSGAVVASRLSRIDNLRILLIEAGARAQQIQDFPEEIRSAHIVAGARPDNSFNRLIPGHITNSREFTATRGRILGGSSATNGGYFIRPRRADFDEWEAAGSALWGYNSALSSLREIENDLTYGSTAIHGAEGPVPVTRTSLVPPTVQTFHQASTELGFTDHLDMNDQGEDGFGAVPTNTVGDVQYNSAMTYLDPSMERPGLTIWADSTVERVLFNGTAAAGVRLRRNGEVIDVYAGEVILSAGALVTPQLLMLSGIGPADELAHHSIPLVLDSPLVGQGLSDHPQLVSMWTPKETSASTAGSWMGGVLHVHIGQSEIEALQSIRSLSELIGEEPSDATALMLAPVSPRRTGHLKLVSASIDDPPVVYYNYLTNADVRSDLRTTARLARDILSTQAVTSQSEWSWGPAAEECSNDVALDAWIAQNLGTSMHACATASFAGEDPVVDPEGRVIGVTGLRIADTSILPAAPRRGPAVAALLIGELIASAMTTELTR
jgi:choline dehydrogenase-like flavoprotein